MALLGVLFAVWGMVWLAGCARGGTTLEEELVPAEQLYNEGLAQLYRESYRRSAERFAELVRQHPFSDWARRGLLLQAFSHFRRQEYAKALKSAEAYVARYPASSEAAYAQNLIVQGYLEQVRTAHHDQNGTLKALDAIDALIDRYPQSPYVAQAKRHKLFVMDLLAAKELDVGRFYLGSGRHLAAVNRFRTVVSDYDTTRHVEEALLRLVEAHLALGLVHDARKSAAVLGANYPNSPWYRDAYRLVERRGSPEPDSRGTGP